MVLRLYIFGLSGTSNRHVVLLQLLELTSLSQSSIDELERQIDNLKAMQQKQLQEVRIAIGESFRGSGIDKREGASDMTDKERERDI